jgi:hypothetical protein
MTCQLHGWKRTGTRERVSSVQFQVSSRAQGPSGLVGSCRALELKKGTSVRPCAFVRLRRDRPAARAIWHSSIFADIRSNSPIFAHSEKKLFCDAGVRSPLGTRGKPVCRDRNYLKWTKMYPNEPIFPLSAQFLEKKCPMPDWPSTIHSHRFTSIPSFFGFFLFQHARVPMPDGRAINRQAMEPRNMRKEKSAKRAAADGGITKH